VVVGFYDQHRADAGRGQDVRCVILLNRNPGIALAVRDDLSGTIRETKDLKGRKIGVTGPGSSTDFLLRYLLVRAGVKPEDVSIIGVGSSAAAVAALENKSIDAVMNYDRRSRCWNAQAGACDGRWTHVGRLGKAFGGSYPASCLYSTGAFIAEKSRHHPAAGERVRRSAVWIDKTPPAEIAAALPAEYGLAIRPVRGRDRPIPSRCFPQKAPSTSRTLSAPRRC